MQCPHFKSKRILHEGICQRYNKIYHSCVLTQQLELLGGLIRDTVFSTYSIKWQFLKEKCKSHLAAKVIFLYTKFPRLDSPSFLGKEECEEPPQYVRWVCKTWQPTRDAQDCRKKLIECSHSSLLSVLEIALKNLRQKGYLQKCLCFPL